MDSKNLFCGSFQGFGQSSRLFGYLCHGRIRLCLRIVKDALSFFLDTQTSKVSDFLKKGEIAAHRKIVICSMC